MPPNTCVHLSSTPSTILHQDGRGEPGTAYLCEWGDNHPERLTGMPRWLSQWALALGPNFSPTQDCPGCPGFCDRARP